MQLLLALAVCDVFQLRGSLEIVNDKAAKSTATAGVFCTNLIRIAARNDDPCAHRIT